MAKAAAAGAGRFGFGAFEYWKISAFAAQIILHLIVIASKIKMQNSFFRLENQAQFQIRPALESVRRNFADAQAAVNVRLAKHRLNFPQRLQYIGFLSGDALAEAGRCFNLASH